MVQANNAVIGAALDWEINDWRERQIDALNQAQFPQIGTDPFLKANAWLNFGVDATKTLFPSSSAAAIINQASARFAVPLWILGQAQEGFRALYTVIINDHNRHLRTTFTALRDDFVRRVQGIARTFKNEPYGRNITGQISRYLGSRQFRDTAEMDTFLRELVHNAGLIETDPTVLRQKTNQGFSRLCSTIYDIYLGSSRGPGSNEMWYASSRQQYLSSLGTSRGYRRVRTTQDEAWLLAHAWQMETRHIDQPWISRRRDTTYVTRVSSSDSPIRLARSYTGTRIDLAAAERRMRRSGARR